jgi:uncharacterized membrane protein required for colicin V production
MDSMNTLDIVAAVLVAAALFLGYHRGFVAQLVSIAGLFIAYLAAYWLYDDVSPVVARFLPLDRLQNYGQFAFLVEGMKWNVYFYNAVAFAVIFFVVKIGMSVVGRLLHLIVSMPGLKTFNKWSGAALALLEAIILFIIAVHVMIVIPSEQLQRTLEGSVSAGYTIQYTPELTNKLMELWNKERPN